MLRLCGRLACRLCMRGSPGSTVSPVGPGSRTVVPSSERLPFAETPFHRLVYVQNLIGKNLRSLIFLEIDRSPDCHNPVGFAYSGASFIHVRKNHNLTDAEKVFKVYESHHPAALCNECLLARYHAADYAAHAVTEHCTFPVMCILLRMGDIIAADG